MKLFLTLGLLVCQLVLHAQKLPSLVVYTDAHARYQLMYPRTWLLRKGASDKQETTFIANPAEHLAPVMATLSVRTLPEKQKTLKLTAAGEQDSLWRRIQRLPQAQVLRVSQQDFGSYEEVRYDYTFALTPASPARTHVVGRQLWRGGYEFRIEYRGPVEQDDRYLAEGRRLITSFTFTNNAWPSLRYADQVCDGKMYGIAASHLRNGNWEDDCRTIHEFSTSNPKAPPVVHYHVLPFQSYALAKGFDNCLYSVTKAPTDTSELVYRYDPATRQGRYTTWKLPRQGREVSWISGATDEHGDLYFLTSDANLLVKVSPPDGSVKVVWSSDPMRRAPFYPMIAFDGAGTHGNFCLDDTRTLYMVYSTNGSLLKVDLDSRRPSPELMVLAGLPKRGGYSDLLMQKDQSGQRRLFLAGPTALYQADLGQRRAHLVRSGTYTDLAGCNVFRMGRALPLPPPPTTATWRGRVLNALTYQPLPRAEVHFRSEAPVPLSPDGRFSLSGMAGHPYAYQVELAGYMTVDSVWTATPGPVVQDILLRPLAVGTTQVLDNVQFEQGKAVLLPSSLPALQKLLWLLSDNPGLTIELRGHTDNVGPPQKNVSLSEQRVAAVKTYLVTHGIAAARITGIGLGGAEPTASNAQESTRQLNRRVEFRVTSVQ
ncbi:OmpA family protein [Hymenobacter sp. BT664]|uniref:OmpA family protein n=1 Tax=Hymenobacter montanus TaxID=2771359 RepID=A0A927BI75_9BACT|nr:OmpA family protein [Hymenobacter montanus]MBD2770504.1 OmpA family protein [Hymenobacter montanus]